MAADPRVIDWTRRAAQATGADPAALLATALVESGARTGAVGDQASGHASYGPWQMRAKVGALGNRPPSWANSYEAALNRAQEFARLKVHGGAGAAAIQRPADPSGYALKVQANLAQARTLLGAAPPAARAPASMIPTPTAPDTVDNALIQSILDANSQLAGIPGITMPTPQATPTLPTTPTKPTPSQLAARRPGPSGRVIAGKAKIIGTPNSGTHNLGNWESDQAVDIALPTGTPLYAPADGIIGSRIGSLGSSSSRFAGERVHLKIQGNELYYAHLSRLAVKAGQRVKKGQIIGYSGSANGVTHLHLGVQNGDPRRYA